MNSRAVLYSLLGLIVAALVCSCGPGQKLRKAEKLILQAEAMGAEWKRDTVWQTIEVPVPEIRVDTTIVIKQGDSVVVFKDRLEVKIKRLKGDTVFIEAKCLPDTIRIEKPVYINNEITCPKPKWRLIDVIGAALIALIAGFILGKVVKV